MPQSQAEFDEKAKVRLEKVRHTTEAKARRDLGIPEASESTPCNDQRCAVCTVPEVCEQCKSGSTLVQKLPPRVDAPPTFDASGWEVEDEVSSADWPKVCQACSTGCRTCDDPSPAGCTQCFPMFDLGPQGCSASLKAFAMLSTVSVLVILISAYLTRSNWLALTPTLTLIPSPNLNPSPNPNPNQEQVSADSARPVN